MSKHKDIIEDLVKQQSLRLRDALFQAYDAGFADGGDAAREGLEAKFQNFLGEALRDTSSAPKKAEEVKGTRATRGSAKPAVLAALRSNKDGLTTNEVFKHVGVHSPEEIAYNTVRGTLYRLMTKEEIVARKGDVWVLKEQGGLPALEALLR